MTINELYELLRAKFDNKDKLIEAAMAIGVSWRYLSDKISGDSTLDASELLPLLDHIGYEIVPKWKA